MKAMMLTGLRNFRMEEMPAPLISAETDVLLRVESIGVCGSDIHYYTHGNIGSQIVEYPFLVGHELSATVLNIGAAVRRVQPGDRVTVDPAVSCGVCDQCLAGRSHTCRQLKFLGCPGQMQGCLCEYIVMPEKCCFPVDDAVSFDLAALFEPFTIGCYANLLAGSLTDKRIAILGAGPIGLSVLLAAMPQKPSAVYVTDPLPWRREKARKLGADWAGDPYVADAPTKIEELEPLLLDVVFECCGKQEALDDAVKMLRPGGKLMLIGIPTVDRVSFTIDVMRRREICIQNVRRQNDCVEHAIALAQRDDVPLQSLITHKFPFADTAKAFDLVAQYGDNVIKAMIQM